MRRWFAAWLLVPKKEVQTLVSQSKKFAKQNNKDSINFYRYKMLCTLPPPQSCTRLRLCAQAAPTTKSNFTR